MSRGDRARQPHARRPRPDRKKIGIPTALNNNEHGVRWQLVVKRGA